jgi:hypothetical protein
LLAFRGREEQTGFKTPPLMTMDLFSLMGNRVKPYFLGYGVNPKEEKEAEGEAPK